MQGRAETPLSAFNADCPHEYSPSPKLPDCGCGLGQSTFSSPWVTVALEGDLWRFRLELLSFCPDLSLYNFHLKVWQNYLTKIVTPPRVITYEMSGHLSVAISHLRPHFLGQGMKGAPHNFISVRARAATDRAGRGAWGMLRAHDVKCWGKRGRSNVCTLSLGLSLIPRERGLCVLFRPVSTLHLNMITSYVIRILMRAHPMYFVLCTIQ